MARHLRPPFFVVTCEHASDYVPARYRTAFESGRARRALSTHRGVDFGARSIARLLAERLCAPYFEGTMTRLLVDLNRSPRHPRLLSDYSRALDPGLIEELREYHQSYRRDLLGLLSAQKGPLVHLSVHSFTPVFEGVRRKTDVGVLYDPRRPAEKKWGQHLKRAFSDATDWVAHANQPYRGVADGVATWLRRELGNRYAGLELEFNQRLVGPRCSPRIARDIVDCLSGALEERAGSPPPELDPPGG